MLLPFVFHLSSDLQHMDHGFTVNPYDPCVANKMINGKQMTETWHVDDLKISHMDSNEVKKYIKRLKNTVTG